ncbi:hypothetical protein CC80DRAFT_495571 [Byssothecium circinans]|uniref:Uncharacterized protein n=1 Tax=Byssothecium circinans TaxID=147558 RepID=A0A6A5TIP6_9PLEO|nr:hypothetical protein CC80DRAFT_495571 [Byssothecium circinans]
MQFSVILVIIASLTSASMAVALPEAAPAPEIDILESPELLARACNKGYGWCQGNLRYACPNGTPKLNQTCTSTKCCSATACLC